MLAWELLSAGVFKIWGFVCASNMLVATSGEGFSFQVVSLSQSQVPS